MTNADTPSPSPSANVVRAISAAVPDLSITSTVAIVGAKAPTIRQIGSGTLVAVADARFVLTAAHVVREGARFGYTLATSGGKDANFTALGGTWMITSGSHPDATDDKHDVALYQLSQDQVSRLGAVDFVRIADASFQSDLSSGYFVVSGFPGMWSTVLDGAETNMKSKLLQYGTWAFTGSEAALDNYDRSHHFLLTTNQSETLDAAGLPVTFRDRHGFSAQMPAGLSGISGCSVWLIGDRTKPIETWDKRSSRIVGIETGVFSERMAIKVTRWNAVTTLLYQAFPALRPSIEMYAH